MTQEATLSFGPFHLIPSRRVLLEGDQPVRIGSRSFDLLVALAERAGETMSNAELIARVWPNVVVEPGALRVHLAGLRKALADGRDGRRFVVNVPAQGYCFVASVSRSESSAQSFSQATTSADAIARAADGSAAVDAQGASPLPALLTRLVGRDELLADVLRELPQRRCITLVGPGGIGKTTLAVAAAQSLAATYGQQAIFVALAPLTDPALVPGALSSALGIPALAANPVHGLTAYLRNKRLLVVLDNCEHVIDAVAEMAESLMRGAVGVSLLVTSREPLRIQGEWVQRLASLQVPPPGVHLDVAHAQAYAAVDLFMERVHAAMDKFRFGNADVAEVCEICRALDGIPLALELAAAGVERLGLQGVAAQLGQRLTLLTRGRRTALPRHQTLRATLDWGHALLSASEQTLFRRLSVFKGRFTREGALAVGASDESAVQRGAAEHLVDLVSKSLVVSDVSGEAVQYWLLETTREYAAEQLRIHGEAALTARLHARHLVEWAQQTEEMREHLQFDEWLSRVAHRLDDVRAALAWAFSSEGDAEQGCLLAAASAPLWFALSRMAEYLRFSNQAMTALSDGVSLDSTREVALHEAHGHALWHLQGISSNAVEAFQRALGIAERIDSTPARLRALWGMWLIGNSSGEYRPAAKLAERFGAIAAGSTDAGLALTHHRMMVLSLHYNGDHVAAQRHAEHVLQMPLTANASARHSGFHFDQRVAATTAMARILWVQGRAESALAHARQAVDRALELSHALSLCYALSVSAVPVAMWSGDWKLAARYSALLRERADEYSLLFWQAWSDGYDLVLRRRLQGSNENIAVLTNPATGDTQRDTLCTIDAGVADDRALLRGEDGTAGWCAAELLRIRAERMLLAGVKESLVEALLVRGLELAQTQGALAWELRAAFSLARMRHARTRSRKSLAILEASLARFDPGTETVDHRQASDWLAAQR